jgi:hypothetical protein
VKRKGKVSSVCFSADGKYLAIEGGWDVGVLDKKVIVISTLSWMVVHKLEQEVDARCVGASADGQYLALLGEGDSMLPRRSGIRAPIFLCVVRAGPKKKVLIAPIEAVKKLHLAAVSYDPYVPTLTLLQYCVQRGFNQNEIEALVNHDPRLICAVNTDSASDSDIFATAIARNDPKLLLFLLSVVFGQSGDALLSTTASDIVLSFQSIRMFGSRPLKVWFFNPIQGMLHPKLCAV